MSEPGDVTDLREEPRPPKRRRRRRRKFFRRLLFVFIGLFVVILFTPTLLSTGPGNRLMLSIGNSFLVGRVEVESIRLSWFRPFRMKGLRVFDAENREVISVDEFVHSRGLVRVIVDPLDFDQARVSTLAVSLYMGADGLPSLAHLVREREESDDDDDDDDEDDDDEPDGPPAAWGTVAVANASVLIVLQDGRRYEVSDFDTTVSVETTDKVAGSFDVALADGGKMSTTFDLTGLAAGDFNLAGGKVTIKTSEAIELQPLLSFLGAAQDISGRAAIDVTADIKDGAVEAQFRFGALELQELDGEIARPPLNGVLTGNLTVTADHVSGKIDLFVTRDDFSGNVDLATNAGQLTTTLNVPISDLADISEEAIVAAIEGTEAMDWPAVAIDTNGRIDLVVVAESVPSILRLLPGVELQTGSLIVDHASFHGGQEARASGRIALVDVTATRGGELLSVTPIELTVDALIDPVEGLRVEAFSLDAGFARLRGSGARDGLTTEYSVKLSEMATELGQLIDLGEHFPNGHLHGRFDVVRDGDRVGLNGFGYADKFDWAGPHGSITMASGVMKVAGALLLVDNKLSRLEITELRLSTWRS